jgi:Right handed beta helix region
MAAMRKLLLLVLAVVSLGWGQGTQADFNTQLKNLPIFPVMAYRWNPQTPGGSLTGSSSAAITLTPCPLGVNGTDTNHFLYVSGGTGTAETVLITGGTCTSGATSGTVIFTPLNSHSGAWTIATATGYIQEALQTAHTLGGGAVRLPAGIIIVRAKSVGFSNITLEGTGEASTIQLATNAWPNNASTPSATACGVAGLTATTDPLSCSLITTIASAVNVHFRNFEIDWNKSNQIGWAFGDLISLGAGTTNSSIEDITMVNDAHAGAQIALYGGSTTANNIIKDNWMYGNAADTSGACTNKTSQRTGGPGAIFVQASSNFITGNQMLGGWCDSGIATNGNVTGNIMSHNHFVGGSLASSFGIQIDVGSRNIISNNILEGLSTSLIGIDPETVSIMGVNASDNIIEGNTVICGAGGSTYGIMAKGAPTGGLSSVFTTIIKNNTVTGCGIGIIDWQGADNSQITGNIVYNNNSFGIISTFGSGRTPLNLTISGNQVRDTSAGPGIAVTSTGSAVLTNYTIKDNTVTDDQMIHTQTYGLSFDFGSATTNQNFIISGNNLTGNLTGGITSSLTIGDPTKWLLGQVGPNITSDTAMPFTWTPSFTGLITIGRDVGTAYTQIYAGNNGVFRTYTNLSPLDNTTLFDGTKVGWTTEANVVSDFWRVARKPTGGGALFNRLLIDSVGMHALNTGNTDGENLGVNSLDGSYLHAFPSSSASFLNPLTQSGDQLYASAGVGGSIDTGALCICPFSTGNFGIRFTNTGTKSISIYTAGLFHNTITNNTDQGFNLVAPNGGGLKFEPSAVNTYNPLSQTGDQLITSGGAAFGAGTGSLTIAPFSGVAFGLRFDNVNSHITLTQEANYIADTGVANNAIAGTSTGLPLSAGACVEVKLAHTLQAGANTFNLNAGGALGIKKHTNPANDIGTAYAGNGIIKLCYDGTLWEDMSQ